MTTLLKLTESQKKEWNSNKLKNPITGRSISENGRLYNRIKYAVSGPPKNDKKCSKMWMMGDDSAGLSNIIKCKTCEFYRDLYFVHCPEGDCYCTKCGIDGNYIYFCKKCKNKEDL